MSNLPIKEITFSSDTAQRKRWFTGLHFSHPAKMHLSLQIYLIEHYTKPGDIILDPMLGSGTLLVACALGRNVIGVELEQKFVDMAKANWKKIKSLGPILGYQMGTATILQGDARQLPEVLADVICTSPPFAEAHNQKGLGVGNGDRKDLRDYSYLKSDNPDQISNLSYGSISAIVSSPPYESIEIVPGHQKVRKEGLSSRPEAGESYNRENKENIGNLKSDNYLLAMLQVYQGCYRILREQGLLILVVKNFIRNKKIMDLAADTIKLCEQVGFTLKERLQRKLTQQSFWRIIYYQKYPDAPKIEFEDVLVFKKNDNNNSKPACRIP